ncbi:hypothetical protein MUB24_12825 [Lederbergia sp. NSJ-179]|uniref:hypothetical protein n=1 Tax=Lederbergia sp. NSJ-179 TaxID=2931402 RepID=UPI001FD497DC|nr:hypothetical protein [Lederbergia sp. NSJ-179]MCJ7841766.1 hypothetical protein [Lederbergia sp. NSJ-179]
MRIKKKPPYIMISDRLITEDNEFHLNEKELYLYSLLKRKMNYEELTETSMSFLNLTSPINFGSNPTRANETIKRTLLDLINRGLIRVMNPDGEIINDFKPSDLLIIQFAESDIKGHTEIPFSKFNNFQSMTDYYIYVATARWFNSGDGSFNCSYSRWAKLLGVSESTAKEKIKDAVKKKVIYKNIGDYIEDEKKQRINSYRITPYKGEEKSFMTKREESGVNNPNGKFHSQFHEKDLQDVTTIFSTFKDSNGNNVFPIAEDYAFYMEVKKDIEHRQPSELENKLILAAEKRINILKKANTSKFQVEWRKGIEMFECQDTESMHEVHKSQDEPENVASLF